MMLTVELDNEECAVAAKALMAYANDRAHPIEERYYAENTADLLLAAIAERLGQ